MIQSKSTFIYLYLTLNYFLGSNGFPKGTEQFTTINPLRTTLPSTHHGKTYESVTKPVYAINTTTEPYTDPPMPAAVKPTITPLSTKRPETVKNAETTVSPAKPEEGSSVGLKSKQKCKEYGEFVYIKEWDDVAEKYRKRDTCEIVEPLIVGGNDTVPREFPHQAMIGWGPLLAYPQWYCGGSLIGPSYILTAGHCQYMDPKRTPTIARWVRLGDYKIGDTDDEGKGQSKPVTLEVDKFLPHPEYKYPKNDIGLIKLKSEVHFNQYIRPICLHTERAIPKLYGIATGWGKLKYGDYEPNAFNSKTPLQKVNLTITSDRECVQRFGTASGNTDAAMLCAGGKADPGKDTCQGDSGGPLQIRLAEPHCMYSIVGVTSFGYQCSAGIPGVFSRVSHFVGWIEDTVWPEPM